jgi:dTDP-4-dehydrorhamnose reductase
MKKVVILGATGMLGSAVYAELKEKYELVLAVRDPQKLSLLEQAYGRGPQVRIVTFDASAVYRDFAERKGYPSSSLLRFVHEVGDADFVINAVGVTIPFALLQPDLTFFINSAFPHCLAGIFGERLIHLTTDCAFNGKEGFPYDENSPKTPVDVYGLSKSLGEPSHCLTLRTSIIGRELHGFTGLLEWFLQQEGKTITGFANHLWNGITTREFGRICDRIMQAPDRYPRRGIFHVFSTELSKYAMLEKFREKYSVQCTIRADHDNRLNRTLATVKELNRLLQIPSFDQMLQAL